jgi:hypothetical protein
MDILPLRQHLVNAGRSEAKRMVSSASARVDHKALCTTVARTPAATPA